jgi:hypothetical protein
MVAAKENLGWDFWGRLGLATFCVANIFIGIAVDWASCIFGGIIGTALFGHLAFLRFREIYPSRRGS